MAWQELNIHLDGFYTYLRGISADEGYYCYNPPDRGDDWIVANQFDPVVKCGNGMTFYRQPYYYNGDPLYKSDAQEYFLFKNHDNKWIIFDELRDPFSYFAIDLSTVLGDGWWEVRGAPTWDRHDNFTDVLTTTPKGVLSDEFGDVSCTFKCYEYDGGTSWWDHLAPPYGKYKNSSDQYKVVGDPLWSTTSEDSTYNGLSVFYTGMDEELKDLSGVEANAYLVKGGGWWTGPVELPLRYHPEDNNWIIGTLSSGVWWEGSKPSMDGDASFSAYKIEEGVKTAVTSSDLTISFSKVYYAPISADAYFGEVAEWY